MTNKVILKPFQLLELNVISGQDLHNVSRKMRTYAVAWVHPDRKLSTRVDTNGHDNPTWNDKFVFRVDDEFLHGDTSAIMIEIYALHWFRDVHVGTVRVIVGNFIPPPLHRHPHYAHLGMRFVALQVRRPSGRPQGILNIGLSLLDSSMRSMPLYSSLNTSAVGYRHLMGEKDSHLHHHHQHHRVDDDRSSADNQNPFLLPWIPRPELRRTKSDSSSMVRVLEIAKNNKTVRSKASSMLSGSELIKKVNPGSFLTGPDTGNLTKAKYRFGSVVSDGPLAKTTKPKTSSKTTNGSPETPEKKYPGVVPVVTDSELGPSPSEMAAKMAAKKSRNQRPEETESDDVMGDWSLESSMEGLQSKLDRWRTELPPVYDRSELSSVPASSVPKGGKTRVHRRRLTDGDGSFSCFGKVCGLECSIVCGGRASAARKGRRVRRSQSMDYLSFL